MNKRELARNRAEDATIIKNVYGATIEYQDDPGVWGYKIHAGENWRMVPIYATDVVAGLDALREIVTTRRKYSAKVAPLLTGRWCVTIRLTRKGAWLPGSSRITEESLSGAIAGALLNFARARIPRGG